MSGRKTNTYKTRAPQTQHVDMHTRTHLGRGAKLRTPHRSERVGGGTHSGQVLQRGGGHLLTGMRSHARVRCLHQLHTAELRVLSGTDLSQARQRQQRLRCVCSLDKERLER